ncbi:MAG: TIGR04255 family protein [Chloroflexota bacterium]
MPFPPCQRIIFNKNPLDPVICQFRFPPILSIDNELPSKFQEAIRKQYPLFGERLEVKFNLPSELKAAIPQELLELPSGSSKNYEFISEDETWKINLTNSFLAVSTSQYTRWEEFKTHFAKPLAALLEVYEPSFFTRIGLRYVNTIKRSVIGVDNIPWSDLLNPYIVGSLSEPNIADHVLGTSHTTEIRLSDSVSIVRIRDGLIEAASTGEACYRIDNDFFIEGKFDVSKATEQLDYFNQKGSCLFQWCITDRLRDAMEPEAI